MKWLKRFLNGFSTIFKLNNKHDYPMSKLLKEQVIPIEINDNELFVRAILHPLFYSVRRGKLHLTVVLPPPGKKDVSVLRHDYTDDNFCKSHAKSLDIKQQEYCGLGLFKNSHVIQFSNQTEGVNVEVVATPLDKHKTLREDRPILRTDRGLPMHADLLYDLPPPKANEPNSPYILFAGKLLKKLQYVSDPDPVNELWVGKELVYVELE